MTSVRAEALGAPTRASRPSPRRVLSIAPALLTAAFASIGAGAIHAAAIGVHSEHREAVITFTLVATVQIGWGVLALVYRSRWFALVGALTNAAILGGWILAKTSGISFISGLEAAESAQLADSLAAGLAAVAVVGALVALATRLRPSPIGHTVISAFAFATALFTIPGMVAAGSHTHAAGHDHGSAAAGGGHVHGASVAPVPYDPTKPIDLGGVEGVTPQEQARAENLVAVTLLRLPQFADPAVAEARGFRSIGDGATGDEHYLNLANLDDGRTLDPDFPESLVYKPQADGTKQLEAAMYILPPGQTIDDVPDIGGKLTQWHIHDNPCAAPASSCPRTFFPLIPEPMIHVWILPNRCGPFAALKGQSGGRVRDGETKLCDHAHGKGGA